MKATEIQVGDRLYYKGQYNAFDFRVEQVTKHKVGYHAEPCDNRMHYLRLHEVQPIPLTAELLERNGFVLSSESPAATEYICALGDGPDNNLFVWLFKDRDFAKVYYSPLNVSAMIDVSIPHCSVHQLQHALRLCNIEKEITI